MNIKKEFVIRKAEKNDVIQIVRLLENDPLGKKREILKDPLPQRYYNAFSEIDSDERNFLAVVEHKNKIIGTLQLTIITYLTYGGGKRAQIEGVRIDESCRSQGIGKMMMEWAINFAKESQCHLVQLTMDKSRKETIEFYKKLGFIDSHEGMKLHFDNHS